MSINFSYILFFYYTILISLIFKAILSHNFPTLLVFPILHSRVLYIASGLSHLTRGCVAFNELYQMSTTMICCPLLCCPSVSLSLSLTPFGICFVLFLLICIFNLCGVSFAWLATKSQKSFPICLNWVLIYFCASLEMCQLFTLLPRQEECVGERKRERGDGGDREGKACSSSYFNI